jgi:hypothetical protein
MERGEETSSYWSDDGVRFKLAAVETKNRKGYPSGYET